MNDAPTPLCEALADDISRVLDGTAPAELYEHLQDCDRCRDLRHDAEQAVRRLRGAGADYRHAEGFEQRLFDALDARRGDAQSVAQVAPRAAFEPVPHTVRLGAAPEGVRAPAPTTNVAEGASREPSATGAPRGEHVPSTVRLIERPKGEASPSLATDVAPAAADGPTALRTGSGVGAGGAAPEGVSRRSLRQGALVGGVLFAAAAAAGLFVTLRRGDEGAAVATGGGARWSAKVASIARAGGATGGVERCAAGGGACAAVGVGDELAAGAVVKTDALSRVEIALSDGSQIVLDRSSELALRADVPRGARLVAGALVADVTHLAGESARATIEIPGGRIEVLGTRFSVRADGDRSRVAVARGAVMLHGDSGASEAVRAGEEGRVVTGKPVAVAPTPTLVEGFAWSDRVQKHDTPATDAPDEPLRGLGELRAKKPGQQDERDGAVRLARHDVKVRIAGNVARTEIDETFENTTGDELEGIFRFPLPPDAQIDRLALEVNGKLEEGAFVEKDRAAAIWRGVIQNAQPKAPKPVQEIIWVPGPWRDPALLEWKRGGRFELRIFPVPARGSRRVVLSYTQTVQPVGGVRRYTYPLPHDAKGSTRVADFHLDAQVVGHDRAAGVRATGYKVASTADGAAERLDLREQGFQPAGDLAIEYALPAAASEIEAWAYAPEKQLGDDGSPYVALALRPRLPRAKTRVGRDVVVVVDRSRSMVGERLARARQVAASLVGQIDDADRVKVMACDESCETWPEGMLDAAAAPGVGSRAGQIFSEAASKFLAGQTADGASDPVEMIRLAVDGARADRREGRPLAIVYVGDGGVGAGSSRPDRLTAAVRKVTPEGASVTAVAVGADADAGALAALARGGGGVMVPFVPGQRAGEVALAALSSIFGASLSQPELTLPSGLVSVAPSQLDTLRAGAETIVVARMTSPRIDGEVVLRGKVGPDAFEQRYTVKIAASSDAGNAFVPRLYAAARIADLERSGGDGARQAIVDLSKRFAIASRHTSLLVLESEAMMTAFGLKRADAGPRWTGDVAATGTAGKGELQVDADESAIGALDGFAAAGPTLSSGPSANSPMAPGGGFGGLGAKEERGGDSVVAAPRSGVGAGAGPAPVPTTEAKKAKAAERAAPFDDAPRSRAPRRNMVPMKKVWDRKLSFSPELAAFHDRDSAKIVAAEGAVAANPDSQKATRELFSLLSLHGRLEQAAQVAERWASRDALDPAALVARADVAARTGRRALALRILAGVVDLRPDDAAAQRRVAAAYDALGLRARGCAHRVALAEALTSDATAVADAARCARETGSPEIADRLVAELPADRRAAVDKALAKPADDRSQLRGDVQIEVAAEGGADVDVALIDRSGQRLSWMGGGKAPITSRDAAREGSEAVAFANLAAGSYLVEVSRADAASIASVSGTVTLRIGGDVRRMPFSLTGAGRGLGASRAEVGRIEINYTSRLVPAW